MRIALELITVVVMTLLFKGLLGKIFNFMPEITDGKGSPRSRINVLLWIGSLLLANGAVFLVEKFILKF